MKKRILALMLALTMVSGLVACGGTSTENTDKSKENSEVTEETKEVPEVDTIRYQVGSNGNVFVYVAEAKGYFDEVGLNVEPTPISYQTDALTALVADEVDVTSNQGTEDPLRFIAAGEDLTIVGGYMLEGMYLVAKKGTEWNGPEDLIGKTIAGNPDTTTITAPLKDLGYDPVNEIEWLSGMTHADRLAAVISGEADYAYLGGSQMYAVSQTEEVEIVVYAGDESLMPAYGCCRMNMRTEFVENNPIAVKLLLKALIRAEAYFYANKEECATILAEALGVNEDYTRSFLLNEDYKISIDPVKNSVIKTWNNMIGTGFFDEEEVKDINVEEHINVELYKAALDEVIEEYHDEYPEFYDERLEFFEENNL